MENAESMQVGDMKVEEINKTLQASGMFIQGHTDLITEVLLTPDENFVISASKDFTVRIWNLHSLLQESILEGHQGSVNTLGINSKGTLIVSGGDDHLIILWDFLNRTKIESFDLRSSAVLHIIITKDDKYIISLAENAFSVRSIAKRAEIWNIVFTQHLRIDLFALSLDSILLVTTNKSELKFWDYPKQSEILKASQNNRITALILTNDNTYGIFCVENVCLVLFWSIKKSCIEFAIKSSSIYIDKLLIGDDNKSVITMYKNKAYFTKWDLEKSSSQ